MMTKGTPNRFGLTLLIAMGAVCGFSATTSMADIVPVDVNAFTSGATIETFEGIVGVELTPDPFYRIFADVPVPFDFGSGVSLTFSNSEPDGKASIGDFSLDPGGGFGWALSLDGGAIEETTVIPSSTSFLGHTSLGSSGETVPLGFTFDQPVCRVGAFLEAAIMEGVFDGYLSLEAFDGAGASLGLVEGYADGAGIHMVTGDDLGPLDTWLGLETADGQPLIHSVEFVGAYLAMDDLHFEVPEPSSLSLLAIAALFGLRRRP